MASSRSSGRETGLPQRQELQLVTLYAGYAASTVERDRLLEQATARNRVLETIREMLENLAGPIPVTDGLVIAVQALRHGLQANEVALVTRPDGKPRDGGRSPGRRAMTPQRRPPRLRGAADSVLAEATARRRRAAADE